MKPAYNNGHRDAAQRNAGAELLNSGRILRPVRSNSAHEALIGIGRHGHISRTHPNDTLCVLGVDGRAAALGRGLAFGPDSARAETPSQDLERRSHS